MGVTCYWLEPTGTARVGLRRYHPISDEVKCPLPHGYHDATTYLGEAPLPKAGEGEDAHWGAPEYTYPSRDDPRWPVNCGCGYTFTETDQWQEWSEALYQRADTGEQVTLRDAPDGAMWDAWWMSRKGPGGLCLVVKCPGGGEWMIDGRASNCTMPEDREHYCWVRHGTPPALTVDKNGKTCAAGAGSIQCRDYHGFLKGGVFEP